MFAHNTLLWTGPLSYTTTMDATCLKVVHIMKSWDWDFIIHFGLNHVGKLKGKGSQYNWLRGDLVEEVIGTQDPTLEFVGESYLHFKVL